MRRITPSILLLVVAIPAAASPPPTPPPWVWAAGEVLSAPSRDDAGKAAPLFAEDVVASENGVVVARGKAALLAWRAAEMGYQRRTIGFSEGWSRHQDGGGELMVIDTFEDFDRSKLAPTFLVDPRMLTRSTLYRFGKDHLIHGVDVQRIEGFMMKP